MAIKTVFLTDENGNLLVDSSGRPRLLSLSVIAGTSLRLAERESIPTATFEELKTLSESVQTYSGITNAANFAVEDVAIFQYICSDRGNTRAYVTAQVSAVNETSLTASGIGISVSGADGQAATIQIGTVTTGEAGSQASVTNVGTENDAILNITIPQGADGESGVGIAGVALQGLKFTITYTDGETDEVSIDTQDIAIVRELGTVDGADTVKMPDGSYKSIKEAILALAYPVGAIYASVNNTSPASFLGGTWEALTTDAAEYKWKRTA